MDPASIDALPFVVRHGAQIWPLLVIGAGLAAVAIARWRRRRAGRRRIAEALARPPSPPSLWADGVEVTVRGVLRVEGPAPAPSVAAVGFARGHEQAQLGNRAWPGAWLEVRDGDQPRRVELTGPVAVIAGATATRRRSIPTAQFDQGVMARDRVEAAGLLGRWRGAVLGFHVRSVAAGDEVQVSGRLAASAGTGEQGYREGASRWALEPVRDAVDLAAVRPAFDPPRLTLGAIVLHGGAAAVLMLVALLALAEEIDVEVAGPPGRPVELSTGQALAAILPNERDDVLEALEQGIERSRYADAATVRTLAGIAREVRGCAAAVTVLVAHGHLDDALAMVPRCDRPELHARVLIEHGRYAEAAALARHARLDGDEASFAFLATGAWDDAARTLSLPFGRDPDAALAAIRGDALGTVIGTNVCLAAAALARGEPGVVDDMVHLAGQPGGAACAGLLADLTPPEQRAGWLAQLVDGPDVAAEVLIEPVRVPRLRLQPGPDALVSAVALAESVGDRGAVERLIGDDVPWSELVVKLRAAILLRRGADLPIGTARGGLRIGAASDQDDGIVDRALDGDLGGLAARCQRDDLPRDGRLWLALRHAITGRPAMAACLAHRLRARSALSIGALLWRAGIERDLADAVGDTEAAARWQEIAARHAAILAIPEIATVLEVWDQREAAWQR